MHKSSHHIYELLGIDSGDFITPERIPAAPWGTHHNGKEKAGNHTYAYRGLSADYKPQILIVTDSEKTINSLRGLLNSEYTVLSVNEGCKGIETAKRKKPDLIILDVEMTGMNGYEVCKRLKMCKTTTDIPVLFLNSSGHTKDEAKGFEMGAADYITEPFVPVTILARIHHHTQNHLNFKELKRMYRLALDANPITRWPGNNTIRKHIDELIKMNANQCVLYCDLDNFKSYNDKYGFAKGDKVILDTARVAQKTAFDNGITDAFFGHIGGDDFMLSVPAEHVDTYGDMLVQSFDRMIKRHYNDEDLKQGYILSNSRKNDMIKFPLVSISVAGVSLAGHTYANYLEVSDRCSEVKNQAKTIEGSIFIKDRRS